MVVAEDPGSLVMQIHLRGTLHGELRIEIAANDMKSLFGLDGSEPLREAGRQIMEGLVQRLPKRSLDAGIFAFSVESCELAEPSGEYAHIGRMELGESEGTHCVLRVLADNELVESFQVAEWSVSPNSKGSTQQTVARELERVIDVPLTVTLRFGQRSMRLREVLELNTGTLVELDRQVEDPVDLILDERVIARGEVVIVDGNYGLRVTEIVERPSAAVNSLLAKKSFQDPKSQIPCGNPLTPLWHTAHKFVEKPAPTQPIRRREGQRRSHE